MKTRLARDEDYAEIARLRRQTIRNVNAKDYLRKGIGSRLLEVAEDSLEKQGCKIIHIESTITAKDFYEKNGYKVIKKTAYREDNAPIYEMRKTLKNHKMNRANPE